METIAKNQRLDWIDFARGAGVLLVIIGHAGISLLPKYVIYGFHVPLFFIISGICFSVKPEDKFLTFLLKKIKTILIPYFFVSFIWMIFDTASAAISGDFSFDFLFNTILRYVLQRHYRPIWFLPCIFLSELFLFFIVKLLYKIKDRTVAAAAIILIFFASAILYSQYIRIYLPWCADLILTAVPFMLIGFLLKDEIRYKHTFNIKPATIVFLFIISITINAANIVFFNNHISINIVLGYYANYMLFVISSLTGSFALIGLSKCIEKNRIINYIGRNSIIFFSLHHILFLATAPDEPVSTLKETLILNISYVGLIIASVLIIYVLNELICRTKLRVLLGKK